MSLKDSKFIIVNEYQPYGSDNASTEIRGVFSDYDKAWDALKDLAIERDAFLPKDSDSFQVETDDTHLEFDEYLIMEFIEDEVTE